jgi:hypothetical protein
VSLPCASQKLRQHMVCACLVMVDHAASIDEVREERSCEFVLILRSSFSTSAIWTACAAVRIQQQFSGFPSPQSCCASAPLTRILRKCVEEGMEMGICPQNTWVHHTLRSATSNAVVLPMPVRCTGEPPLHINLPTSRKKFAQVHHFYHAVFEAALQSAS